MLIGARQAFKHFGGRLEESLSAWFADLVHVVAGMLSDFAEHLAQAGGVIVGVGNGLA
jgi:hypothetical protein